MINTVLFDIGGTLHTVENSAELRCNFAARLIRRLAVYGIRIDASAEEFAARLHENAEAYKHWSEEHLVELPQPRIWNEFYLKDYNVGEDVLAPISEELSFLYDYTRVCNIRRPHLKATFDELHEMGMHLGIISNIISTSFGPHIVKEYGIDAYMECIVMSSEAGCRKPGPEIFGIAMDQLGVGPEQTAYVGDTISRDVLGARNAGLALIIQIQNPAIAHRDAAFIGSGIRPDALITDLAEIPGVVRAHNAAAAK